MDKIVKFGSFFVSVLFIICLAAVVFLVSKNQKLKSTFGNIHICFQNENGHPKCGTSTHLLPEYMDEIISKTYIEVKQQDKERQQIILRENKVRLMNISDPTFWEAKPAARLTGKKLQDATEDDLNAKMTPVREWNYGRYHKGTTGFLRHGVRYMNGRLVLPVDGVYFVYSSIDFLELCDPSTGKPNVNDFNKPIKHAIYKFNILDNIETEIIANVQPHQIASIKYYNSYSSYVSTLANLKAGDEISVKVSNITYLRHLKDNHFGLNLI